MLYALANCPVDPEFHLTYTLKDPEAAKNELLAKAVADAKEKAAILATAAGVTLKEIQSVDYSWGEITFESRPIEPMMKTDGCCLMENARFDMDIEPDDIEAEDTVTVVWEIEG